MVARLYVLAILLLVQCLRPFTTSTSLLGVGTQLYAQAATLDAAGQRVALSDTWGAISYGYDGAGRLVGASYPDGASETYTYDPAGNRVGTTRTDAGGVTTTTAAGFDAADQLTSSSAVTGSAAPIVTGYGYDGNGNQTSSAGPAGTTANTFNAQDQLVRQRGPGTDLALVYDGQGDRLRSIEAGGPLPVRRDEARDLAGGRSEQPGRRRAGRLRLPQPRQRHGAAQPLRPGHYPQHLPGDGPAGQRAAGHRPVRGHDRGGLRHRAAAPGIPGTAYDAGAHTRHWGRLAIESAPAAGTTVRMVPR